ncbi:MAG: CapA family protein [Geitlerinemataceae cyanobacterium]
MLIYSVAGDFILYVPVGCEGFQGRSIDAKIRNFQRRIAPKMRENPAYLSRFELARTGNFQAIAYWLNQSLIPAGIYANVGASHQGCVRIWVELPPLRSNNWYLPTLQRQVVRFICHQIWKLNSETIEGVRIVARLAGQRRVLWKQSIRIVTPASRQRQGHSPKAARSHPHPRNETYDTVVRTFPFVGTAALAFTIGFWATTRNRQAACDPHCAAEPSTPVSPHSSVPQAVDTIDFAGEKVSVFAPSSIPNPDNLDVTLLMTPKVGIPASREDDTGLTEADVTIAQGANPQMLSDPAIVETGIDLLDLASEEGMAEEGTQLAAALDSLDRSGLPYIGAGRDRAHARRPTILQVKGWRVAYFAYTTAEGLAATDDRLGLNLGDREGLAEDIRSLRDRVDWVVVNLHWDGELSETPDAGQMDLAHSVIDAGADLVVGYHPQVLQGGEIYRDRPIVYALSHFILGESSVRNFETAAIEVSLKDDRLKIEVLPIQVREFEPRIADRDSGRVILETFEARSAVFDRPLSLTTILPLQPGVEPVETFEFPEIPDNREVNPGLIDLDRDEDFSDPPVESPGESPEPETEWVPDTAPAEEESDPFIRDPFISPSSKSQKSRENQSERWEFPRLRLPFEPKSSPENRDSRQGRSSIDLPSFVSVHPSTLSFPYGSSSC